MGGCAFAPGGHIDYRTDAAPIDDLVDIEPITFGLVRALRQERRQVEDFSRGGEALQQDIDGYDY
jgi:polysaccharide export outer membrane protein